MAVRMRSHAEAAAAAVVVVVVVVAPKRAFVVGRVVPTIPTVNQNGSQFMGSMFVNTNKRYWIICQKQIGHTWRIF